jgi:membrane protease YdiL (CAAX protease family)
MTTLTLADHILFGIIAFVLPLVIVWRRRGRPVRIPQDSGVKIRIYWANSLILWVAAVAVMVVWIVSSHPVSELGFRWPVPASFPHWMLLVALFLLFYFADAAFSWVTDMQHPAAEILPSNWKEFLHFGSIVSVSAAVCEEVVFRGFFIVYLLSLLEGIPEATAIAVVGTAFVFGIAHEYQGGAALVKITLLSILFAWLFVSTGSLLIVIALHFFIDFCSGMLAVLRNRDDKRLLRALQ